jgi:hypothetical protein
MERKGGSSTVVVTAETVKSALSRTKTLTSVEEQTVRMRHGVAADDLRAPLPRAAGDNEELQDELHLLELQLLRAHRAHLAQAQKSRNIVAKAAPDLAPNRSKDKIVRALRRKK